MAPATTVCEAATPVMTSTVATPTLGEEDVFDVLFMSRSQLESRFCTKNNYHTQVEDFSHQDKLNIVADKSQPCEEKVTRTPEARTISCQLPTPEVKQPATKRKRLTTKAFSYPSKQQFNKPVRKRIRIKQSNREEASVPINTVPTVNADSLSPLLKRARVEDMSEVRREERNDTLPPTLPPPPCGSGITKVKYASELDAVEPSVVSVDESVVNDEKDYITSQTETKTKHSVSQEEQMLVGEQDVGFNKQAIVTVSSTKQESITTMDINCDCVKPLPPTEPVSAVQETPPAKAQLLDSAMPQSLSKPPLPKVSGMRRSFAGSVPKTNDSNQTNERPEMSTAPMCDTRYTWLLLS